VRSRAGFEKLPAAIGRAGDHAAFGFIEFFTATIRNRNTQAAYAHAIAQFFAWCELKRIYCRRSSENVVFWT
jgi:integrase/recombinase XerD